MKRFMSTMKKRGGSVDQGNGTSPVPQGDSPEAIVVREVTAFCESGGPGGQNAGDEYLHLPAIVDAAECSPAAAKEAATWIRKFLGRDNMGRAYAQYNAVMLTRILTDNPAERFTRNIDNKFIAAVKELLREGRDMSVQQILRETLDYFENEKVATNTTLGPLMEMWKKEKAKTTTRGAYAAAGPIGSRVLNAPPYGQQVQQQQNYFGHRHRSSRGLPPPEELAAKIEEAKTTARLLLQTIQSTPQSEILSNDLIKEFADRASSLSRTTQGFINCDNPAPDEDTMLTLIETNEQLSIAMSKHQRALLQARKAASQVPGIAGQNVYPTAGSPARDGDQTEYTSPPGPPPAAMGALRSSDYAYSSSPPPIPDRNRPITRIPAPQQTVDYGVSQNPFLDENPPQHPVAAKTYSLFDRPSQTSPTSQPENLQSPLLPQFGGPPETSGQQEYQPYNPGYHPTQSYIGRQESSTNQLTMHGASPPPPQHQLDNTGRRPVSPVTPESDALQRRMENMRV